MRRSRRILLYSLLAAVPLVVVATQVHLTPARRLVLVDAAGQPLGGTWVAYHFLGRRFAMVQSNTWERPGALVRADEDGVVELPRRVHRRSWPLDTGPERFFDLVYAPGLHNATGAFGPQGRPGRIAVEGDRLYVADVSAAPEAWAETVETLHSLLRRDLFGNHAERWGKVRPETVDDLVNAVAAEYTSFQRTWGRTARPRPPTPTHASGADLRAWEAATARDLAASPLWGPFMARRWEDDLRELRAVAAAARREALVPAEE